MAVRLLRLKHGGYPFSQLVSEAKQEREHKHSMELAARDLCSHGASPWRTLDASLPQPLLLVWALSSEHPL